MMRAMVYTSYGPPEVLHMREVDKPVPKPDEVRVRIHATTVTAEDPNLRSFTFPALLWLPAGIMFGFRQPKRPILGFELAGEIDAVGNLVRGFQVGDQVCGHIGTLPGTYAEYACLPESGLLAKKPANLSCGEAAAIPNGALTAWVFLHKKGKVAQGDRVLIYGASGAVGSAAVQIAKILGASVTAVCSSGNIELMRSIGADHVVDYMNEDFTARGEQYDIIFDTVGKTSYAQCKRSLRPKGRYLLTVFGLREIGLMVWTSLIGGKRVIGAASNMSWQAEDLHLLTEMAEAGQWKPVIDRVYPLEQLVEAHRYVEQGRKKGNVIIQVIP